jgi:hypothetical protein
MGIEKERRHLRDPACEVAIKGEHNSGSSGRFRAPREGAWRIRLIAPAHWKPKPSAILNDLLGLIQRPKRESDQIALSMENDQWITIVSKGLRHGRESHIKIDLATVSKEICSQAIVSENNDGGVSQRHLGNSQS